MKNLLSINLSFQWKEIKITYMNQSYRVVLHVSSFFNLLFFRWYHPHHDDDKYSVAISFQNDVLCENLKCTLYMVQFCYSRISQLN